MRPEPRTALIVDDERLARRELATLLGPFESVRVVGEADSVAAAARAVEQLHPEIVFLDIQMPGESGFDLLAALPAETTIVFVTAHDEYAVRAFEVNALDYLLKPVNPERLKSTLERILSQPSRGAAPERALEYDDRLFLAGGPRPQFVKVSSIVSIQAAGDYADLTLQDGAKSLTPTSIAMWEKRLPAKHFVRIHRGTIVNLEYVERVEPWFNHAYRVHLKAVKQAHVVSRRYAARLRAEMR